MCITLLGKTTRIGALLLLGLSHALAQLGESRLQWNLLFGQRSETGASFRYTGLWGLYGEAGGGLVFLFVEDTRPVGDPLTSVWAWAPRLELGQQLLQGQNLGWEAYVGLMPWGHILDNTQGCCWTLDNQYLRWNSQQGYAGMRIGWTRSQPQAFFWDFGAYAELGYTRLRIVKDIHSVASEDEIAGPGWTAAGFKLRLGVQTALGWRGGAQPVQRSLRWAVRAQGLDSAANEKAVLEAGLQDAHPMVRRSVLPRVRSEAQLADIVVQDSDSTVRQAAMALIKDPGLRHYLQAVQEP